MKFYLTDLNKYVEITCRPWIPGSGYGPDCFSDLEDNLAIDYTKEEGGDAWVMPAEDYMEIAEWWAEEVRCMNAHIQGEICDYSECDPNANELILDYDRV